MQDCFLFRFGEKQSCIIYGCDVQVKITLTGNEHLRKKMSIYVKN